MRTLAFLVALALALAGCAGTDSDDAAPDDGLGDSGGTGSTDEGAEAEPLPDPPTGWLMDDDETLHEGDPEEDASEEFPVSSFHKGFTGQAFDFYIGTGPQYRQDLVITDAEFEVTVRHDSASVNFAQAFGIDEPYGMSFSTDATNNFITFFGQDPVKGPGGMDRSNVNVNLPPGGLVIPTEATMFLAAASLYANPDDVAGVVFLMNGPDDPSGITAETEWTTLPAVQDAETLLDESGTFPAPEGPNEPGCGDSAQEGVAKISHTVEIPDDAGEVYVEAVGASNADVDIYIQAGGDRFGANFPGSPEFFRAYKPNLEAVGTGTWTVELHNCSGGELDYDITVDVHRLVPVLESEVVPTEPASN